MVQIGCIAIDWKSLDFFLVRCFSEFPPNSLGPWVPSQRMRYFSWLYVKIGYLIVGWLLLNRYICGAIGLEFFTSGRDVCVVWLVDGPAARSWHMNSYISQNESDSCRIYLYKHACKWYIYIYTIYVYISMQIGRQAAFDIFRQGFSWGWVFCSSPGIKPCRGSTARPQELVG